MAPTILSKVWMITYIISSIILLSTIWWYLGERPIKGDVIEDLREPDQDLLGHDFADDGD